MELRSERVDPLELAEQSATLNSALLCQFLFGGYTGIFAVTIHMYLHKENRIASSKTVIVGSMTALYVLTTITVALSWFNINKGFIGTVAGLTSGKPDASFPTLSMVMSVLQTITENSVTFIIADGVLVWRCFHACGRSFRSSILPITLFILESVLVICDRCLDTVFLLSDSKLNPWLSIYSILFTLDGAMYISVAATSLTSTFVICWQVYVHTKHGSRSRRRYRNVMDALIQSSALYSSVLVIEAVLDIMEGPLSTKPTTLQTTYLDLIAQYVNVVVALLTGIAPTLMVARLIASSSHENTEISSSSFPIDLITHPTSHSNGFQGNNSHIGDVETQWNGEADSDSLISQISRQI
ncbi:hypothetical protein D9613_007358 [Agrocybe pediades]|uniref:Uncharacterized protein n=1 Tax=Agrocybe pediades TaxID=84607 RepID=A0A8H4QN06_9AGAR|nr:hypothetical protein D9613_007358 [Agrocybe pediades]